MLYPAELPGRGSVAVGRVISFRRGGGEGGFGRPAPSGALGNPPLTLALLDAGARAFYSDCSHAMIIPRGDGRVVAFPLSAVGIRQGTCL